MDIELITSLRLELGIPPNNRVSEIVADINLTNSGTGWTACHCAAFQAHGKVLMKLMKYKPNLTIKDSQGRTASDFASALDTIWPFFAAEGCSRTPKTELIRLGIVRKVTEHDPVVPITNSDVAHFSRPGSAYVMKGQSLHSKPFRESRNTQMLSAAQMGDVLCLEEDPGFSAIANDAPKFSIWKN
ncbi:hypothetical protein BSL78_00809 [Apostichopus japonicus]|uniref:Uncharacterized protein n=1 Tax=Stichopus japonicus TaxID=307972 RepID=A0A2G8LPU8_STIJA|nr:hypothetical protein BSL78_00809 [Apostichopus japonicus]